MAFSLPPRAEAAGYRLVSYDTVGSTNDEAAIRARAGETHPTWFAARHQSAGRGRRGAVFHSPPGNLAASLLLSTDLPPRTVATLGFVAGLALGEALERCCGAGFAVGCHSGAPQASPEPIDADVRGRPERSGLRTSDVSVYGFRALVSGEPRNDRGVGRGRFLLKWPNDVLVGGAKLSGIALETEERIGLPRYVVVGIGVNVAEAPSGLPYPAVSLASLGSDVTAERLFEALADAWMETYSTWDEGRGFAEIRRQWLARAFGLGGEIVVRTASAETRGRFESLDEAGQLVLGLADGTRRAVSAGEIHFGMTARAAATGPAETRP